MKTITFSNDQVNQVRFALHLRIEFLLEQVSKCESLKYQADAMIYRDALEVAMQALAAVTEA